VSVVTPALPRHTSLVLLIRALAPLAFVLAACASSVGVDDAPASSPADATSSIEVVKIVTRDRSILVSTRQHAVRVTVLDANGRLIAREVPVDELQSIDATAYDACKSSVATGRSYVDSSLPY
jgi:hypothetical protein